MAKLGTVEVSYSRSIQPKQFESAASKVNLSLIFDEGEEPDVDEVITTELARCKSHVEKALGIGGQPKKPSTRTKPAAAKKDTKPSSPPAGTQESGAKPPSTSGQTATKPASPSKAPPKPTAKATPPKPAAKGPEEKPADDAPQYDQGDMMRQIAATIKALQAKGISDGPKRINEKVAEYLPDNKPPISHNRIAPEQRGAFIAELKDMANLDE